MKKLIIIILTLLSVNLSAFEVFTEVIDSSFTNVWAVEKVDSGLYITEKAGKLWFLDNDYNKTLLVHKIVSSTLQNGMFDVLVDNNLLYLNWVDMFNRHRLAIYWIQSAANLVLLDLRTVKENLTGYNNGGRMILYQNKLIISIGDTLLDYTNINEPQVYASGLKNCQGLAVRNGLLYASSHGSGTTDRLDVIIEGNDYSDLPTLSDHHIAPSGSTFLNDTILLQASLKNRGIYEVNTSDYTTITRVVKDYGRIRDVSMNTDNLYEFWSSTTNNDWLSLSTDPNSDYILKHTIKRSLFVDIIYDDYITIDYYDKDSSYIGMDFTYVKDDTTVTALRGSYAILKHHTHLDIVINIDDSYTIDAGRMSSGDFNNDGVITIHDFNMYYSVLMSGEYNFYVDANGDGTISVADYNEFFLNLSAIGHYLIRD